MPFCLATNQEDSGECMIITINHPIVWMPIKSREVHEKEGKSTGTTSGRAGDHDLNFFPGAKKEV
jgi:hypothetical protein